MCRPSPERSACASFVPRCFIIAKRDRTGTWSRAPMSSTILTNRSYRASSGAFEHELRVDQHERHVGGARRLDAVFHRRAKQRLVDADERVVGADLPDHEFRPAGFQRGLEALQRLDGEFPADAGVPDVRGDAVLMGKLVLETRRIGVARANWRRSPRWRTIRSPGPRAFGPRRCPGSRASLRVRTPTQPEHAASSARADAAAKTNAKAPARRARAAAERRKENGRRKAGRTCFCTRSSGRWRTGRRRPPACTPVPPDAQPLQRYKARPRRAPPVPARRRASPRRRSRDRCARGSARRGRAARRSPASGRERWR